MVCRLRFIVVYTTRKDHLLLQFPKERKDSFAAVIQDRMKYLSTVILMMAVSFLCRAQSNPTLTAVFDKDQNAIKLHWQHSDKSITFYVVQRSSDNVDFTDVFSQVVADIEPGELLKYKDPNASLGKYYYRLKIYRSGSDVYQTTQPVMVIPTNLQDNWIIYPVPVTTKLHLQYAGSGQITGVITVMIASVSSGRIFVRLRAASTSRTIDVPVSNLGKGLYDIHVYIEDKPVWSQRFVK